MATSGAYVVSEINEDSFVYTARDDYYRGTPSVKKVVIKTIGSGSTKQIEFENGGIDYMRVTSAEDLKKYKEESDKYNMYSISEARLLPSVKPTRTGNVYIISGCKKSNLPCT